MFLGLARDLIYRPRRAIEDDPVALLKTETLMCFGPLAKENEMRYSSSTLRRGQMLLAGVVAILTLAVVAQATQTITTPNAAFVSYNLAAGANSAAIFPAANQSVLVMGTCTTLNFRGVGHVTMLRIPGSFLEWVGLESTAGSSITEGFSGVAGTHIVYLDFSHQVDIEVNTTDSFRVHNGSPAVRTGNVTLIW
jgi:hypothetical protein